MILQPGMRPQSHHYYLPVQREPRIIISGSPALANWAGTDNELTVGFSPGKAPVLKLILVWSGAGIDNQLIVRAEANNHLIVSPGLDHTGAV